MATADEVIAKILPEEARNVLAVVDSYPWAPSDFIVALIKAFAAADVHNQIRLGAGFPHYALAWQLWSNHPDGARLLRAKAEEDR